MLNASNLTAAEVFRINGALPVELQETLLRKAEQLDEARACVAHVQEAAGQYPDEDFLQDAISDLQTLAKRMRGDNRADLLALVEKLETIQTDAHNSTSYGLDELSKAESILDAD